MDEASQLSLTHSLTPLFLSIVNKKIEDLVFAEEVETAFFFTLVSLRHKLIMRELNKRNLCNKKQFVECEIKCNEMLESITYRLREQAKNEVIKFKRANNAVKRYK